MLRLLAKQRRAARPVRDSRIEARAESETAGAATFAAASAVHFREKTKDGKVMEADLRYTGIWEKRGSNGCWCMNMCPFRWPGIKIAGGSYGGWDD